MTDKQGRIVGDSHRGFPVPKGPRPGGKDFVPIVSDGTQVGSFLVDRSDVPMLIEEPQLSRLVSAQNQTLVWAGLATGLGALCS